ncbi:MAG: putative dehydrogenase [Planctomycetota bacterium]|jgi:predicted dehydrogenase
MAECQLAIVGCGGIADAYAKALQRMPNARLSAVVDPDASARARIAGDDGSITQHTDIESLPDVDAVLVLAPPNVHESLSCALLQRGMHVLCEKPLAPTVAAAKRMLQCAETAGRRLMMGSKFRYTADVTKARALLDENVCGDIVIYENVFCSHVDMTQRWNAQAEISGGGVLIDNGCHSVDLARYLLGPLAKVQAQFGTRVQPLQVEDTARMLFQSQSGALGSIDLSWSIRKETDAYVRLHGTKGTLEIGWRGSRWKTTDGEWQAFGSGYDKIAAFQAQLENFVLCISGDTAAVIGDTDAMASVVVIDCAYQSAQQERWVTIPV